MRSSVSFSRDFIDAGVDKDAADIIADTIVTHADDSHATKADLAELKGELKTEIAELRGELITHVALTKTNLVLMVGIYIGLAVMFLGDGG